MGVVDRSTGAPEERRSVFACTLLLVGCSRDSGAPEPTPPGSASEPDGSQREVRIDGGAQVLGGDLLVPAGGGPFPAIVYNHGSEPNPSLRCFQEHGFVVLVPYRRGTSRSEGPYWRERYD